MSRQDHGVTTAAILGFLLLPHQGSRLIAGWLYNSAGAIVLIAGLFHAMHNAIVNSTGLVAVVDLRQFDVLVIMAGLVFLAGVIIAIATRVVSDSSPAHLAFRFLGCFGGSSAT
jgi:hypothetical protein